MLLAVLTRHCKLPLHELEVYVATVGGIAAGEPAADLGIALALASAVREIADPADGVRDRRGLAVRRRAPGVGDRPAAGRGRPARLHHRARARPRTPARRSRRARSRASAPSRSPPSATPSRPSNPWSGAPVPARASGAAHDSRRCDAIDFSQPTSRETRPMATTELDEVLRDVLARGRAGHLAARRARADPARQHRRADRDRLGPHRRGAVHRRLPARRRRVLGHPAARAVQDGRRGRAQHRRHPDPARGHAPDARSGDPHRGVRHPAPHRAAGRPPDRLPGDLGVAVDEDHQPVRGRPALRAREHRRAAHPRQPGDQHPRAVQGPPGRGVQRAVRARDRGPGHRPRRRRGRAAAGDGAPHRRRGHRPGRRAGHRRPAARPAARGADGRRRPRPRPDRARLRPDRPARRAPRRRSTASWPSCRPPTCST